MRIIITEKQYKILGSLISEINSHILDIKDKKEITKYSQDVWDNIR